MESYILALISFILGFVSGTVVRRMILINRRRRTQAAIYNLLWGKKG